MSSDLRVSKSRQPKAYTDRQLEFLKSFLPEYERRSQGSIRGDSKKFAFQKAAEYIVQFGLSPEFVAVENGETRFKEQIYNWFKNTVGRNRRKAEGRTRASTSKKVNGRDEKGAVNSGGPWNAAPSTSNLAPPYAHHGGGDPGDGKHVVSSASPVNGTSGHVMRPMQYNPIHALGSPMPPTNTPCPSNAHTPAHVYPLAQSAMATTTTSTNTPTQNTFREAFLTLDTPSIASMIQTYCAATHPASPTPLTAVVEALFEASITENPAYNRDPHPLVRRYAEVATYLPLGVVHAGFVGPMAAYRALQMQIRRNSIWAPAGAGTGTGTGTGVGGGPAALNAPAAATSLSEDMQRIANERQRRKDHIQWARIHAASLELGMMTLGREPEHHNAFGFTMGRAFSEMVARDAVWEFDEAEWVAGIFVLRAVIRTAVRGDRRQREEYGEILRSYESRWKEIKDEVRQTMVTEVLLSSKEELARLEESLP